MKKIEKHLKQKDKSDYNELEKIFELYINGDLNKMLSEYKGVGIYPTLNKSGKSIQLNYSFHNINVIIDFFEDNYNVVIYHAGISEDELEKLAVDYAYQTDFELQRLLKDIDKKIKEHPQLKDTVSLEKKKTKYVLIAWISWCLPILLCGSVALYGLVKEETIKVEPTWAILFIAVPLIIGCIFDIKSKRLK